MKRVFKGHAYYTNDKDIVEFLKTQPLADFQAKGVTYSLVGIVQIMHNLSFDMALNKLKDEFAAQNITETQYPLTCKGKRSLETLFVLRALASDDLRKTTEASQINAHACHRSL